MSTWGNLLRLSIFGESHGPEIGVVIDGLPAAEPINLEELTQFCARRAPGRSSTSTSRRETDQPQIKSGFYQGKTTGTPLCVTIANRDMHSGDYRNLESVARPGHADYSGSIRYHGANDPRGGGHFSGRLTAPLVAAGGIAKQLLSRRGVEVGAHILSIQTECDTAFSPTEVTPEELRAIGNKPFPVLDDAAGERMIRRVEAVAAQHDSLGGIVECAVTGYPAGIGSPMFDGIENRLSSLLFGIPAIKGIAFGAGFEAAQMSGSEHNDPFRMQHGSVITTTNHHGGILGGISTGMPILLRVAVKPTPSIAQEQHSIDWKAGVEQDVSIVGRHDPCIVPRAVPCVEAAVAFGLLALLLESQQGGSV